jgi:hypothetical protein
LPRFPISALANYIPIFQGADSTFDFLCVSYCYLHLYTTNILFMKRQYTLLFFLALLLPSASVWGQASSVEFGKNRVQYHDNFSDWSMYESRNFITYWYGEARFVGQSVVQMAEYDFRQVERILEHRMNDKIEIIVYVDVTDLKQSNIGSEEVFLNEAGQTKIVGNKMFVYFDGNHNNLRRQVREGVASVYLNSMLFGSNLQEIVQNAVMMNLPPWFKDGMVSFVGEEWNTDLDDQMRDVILSKRYEDFEAFSEDNPSLAGHSLWYFIGQNFGTATVSNLLYLTRINRSVESGFLYVLGSSFDRTLESWEAYFEQRYLGESRNMQAPTGEPLPIKNRKELPITHLKLSPDGKKVAYALNNIGQVRVYIYDLETEERTTILKDGFKNPFQATDYNYPLLAWTPSGMELGIMWETKDIVKFTRYDLFEKKRVTEDVPSQFQRVYSMDFINNKDLVVSAAVRGFSDIFLYFTNTRQTQRITQDFWDDLDACFVKIRDRRGILFASNRQDSLIVPAKLDTILPIETFDLFYYDLESRSSELVQVTHTPLANERHPSAIDTTYFTFLSDQNGIHNRYVGYLEDYIHHYEKKATLLGGMEIFFHPDSALTTKLDSASLAQLDTVEVYPVIKERGVSYSVSNYDRNIAWQHTAPQSGRLAEIVVREGVPQVYVHFLHAVTQPMPNDPTFYRDRIVFRREKAMREAEEAKKKAEEMEIQFQMPVLEEKEEVPIDLSDVPAEKQDTSKVDIDNYLFQSEFDDEELPEPVVIEDSDPVTVEREPKLQPLPAQKKKKTGPEVPEFQSSRIVPYRLKFRADFVTINMDNSVLFDGLNSFGGVPQDFVFPPPGILLKANFKDLFEDYQLEGGVRVPITFNGAEYFLVYDNKKKRIDQRIAAYRRVLRFNGENAINSPIPPRQEANTFLAQYQLRYPFDIFGSLRAIGTMRIDNNVRLATDTFSLGAPSFRENRLGLRLEYVFDNTFDRGLNIKNGTRFKIYSEVFKAFQLEFIDRFEADFARGFLGVAGIDFRHYQPVLKHSVLATRIAGAASFGPEPILFFLGGTDQWLFPRFNEGLTAPDIGGNYSFQVPATNLRGFRFNIRNGSSYALANTELRIPLFKYFSKNLRSNFLRNFQFIGFFDVGTAWEGLSPFSDDNPLNTKIIPEPTPEQPNPPVTVKVQYFRDPIVMGYGAGVRMMLLGYFLRVDYAYGIETRVVQDPRIFLSLGKDF